MFDINSRMEQWSAANHAQHTEDIKKALETPAQPPQTEEVTKSASVADRAKPFIKSEGPHFNIDARVDAWNHTERAGDTATYESLTKSNPFKKAEGEVQSSYMAANMAQRNDMPSTCRRW